MSPRFRPAASILALGDGFYDVVAPAKFPCHVLRFRNDRWSARVGLGDLDEATWQRHFGELAPLAGSLPEALALRYHGHQFGVYNPALGDGRGFLLAQLLEEREHAPPRLLDLGTKGSGQTPWSRGGDGRLTLKGGVREVLATEMLEALDVPTSKSFSLFETGEKLHRGDEPSPTRSAVLVRLSHSHVRFGTFQRFAYTRDLARLRKLFEYTVLHYFPDAKTPGDLLREVTTRSAALCASWMVAGFVHGVLNTDNMNVTGESFDYGPYRFLPRYDPAFTAAYFDESGLYAFGHQPGVVGWNLRRLAEALSLLDGSPGAVAVDDAAYEAALQESVRAAFFRRLGIAPATPDEDDRTVGAAFEFFESSQVGYDRFFFDWYGGAASERRALGGPAHEHYRGPRWDDLRRALEGHAPSAPGHLASPYFQGESPCSLLIDEIEQIWAAIAAGGAEEDWGPFTRKIAAIRELGALREACAREGAISP